MRILIVVPRISRNRHSGGIWCILEYARGLANLGHNVTVLPILPSPNPTWFPPSKANFFSESRSSLLVPACRSAMRLFSSRLHGALGEEHKPSRDSFTDFSYSLGLLAPGAFSDTMMWALGDEYVARNAPEVDIVLATAFETARPASLLRGKKFYFAQHFEPYFCEEFSAPEIARTVARQSYGYGMQLIANSRWLREKFKAEFGDVPVQLCPNAIDHQVFCGKPKAPSLGKKTVVISYGGRNAAWKGFREMTQAMAISRKSLPEHDIEWRVYGDAMLPHDNEIASYKPLGFLSPSQLASQYREADILLSASWYESFPLFPIEAMACGLAVVTTQLGTEEYVIPGVTAEVVEPKNPQSIANGLIRLVSDTSYRNRVACEGNAKSHEFTWERSVRRMEQILVG